MNQTTQTQALPVNQAQTLPVQNVQNVQTQVAHTAESLKALTIPKLKDILRLMKLRLGGNKADLIARILNPVAVESPKQKVVKAKKAPKDPVESLKNSLRSGDLQVNQVLFSFLEIYGLGDRYPNMLALVKDVELNKPAPLPRPSDYEGYKSLKVVELRKILKEQGAKVSGTKEELINRILNPEPVNPVSNLPPAPSVTNLPSAPLVIGGITSFPAPVVIDGVMGSVPPVPGTEVVVPLVVDEVPVSLPNQAVPVLTETLPTTTATKVQVAELPTVEVQPKLLTLPTATVTDKLPTEVQPVVTDTLPTATVSEVQPVPITDTLPTATQTETLTEGLVLPTAISQVTEQQVTEQQTTSPNASPADFDLPTFS